MENEVLLISGDFEECTLIARYEHDNRFILLEIKINGEENIVGSIYRIPPGGYKTATREKYGNVVDDKWLDLLDMMNRIQIKEKF